MNADERGTELQLAAAIEAWQECRLLVFAPGDEQLRVARMKYLGLVKK